MDDREAMSLDNVKVKHCGSWWDFQRSVYVTRQKSLVEQELLTRPVLSMCEQENQRP